jgi:hypothetical protein
VLELLSSFELHPLLHGLVPSHEKSTLDGCSSDVDMRSGASRHISGKPSNETPFPTQQLKQTEVKIFPRRTERLQQTEPKKAKSENAVATMDIVIPTHTIRNFNNAALNGLSNEMGVDVYWEFSRNGGFSLRTMNDCRQVVLWSRQVQVDLVGFLLSYHW